MMVKKTSQRKGKKEQFETLFFDFSAVKNKGLFFDPHFLSTFEGLFF